MQENNFKIQEKEIKENWFNGKLYEKGQPFPTFINSDYANFIFLKKEIKKFLVNPQKMTALEIGPGNLPITPFTEFKKMFFLEKSRKISEKLKRTRIAVKAVKKKGSAEISFDFFLPKEKTKKMHIITGDLSNLPFKKEKKFDFVLLEEVLTHIEPKNRINTIKKIMDLTDSIIIVDRKKPLLKEQAFFCANVTGKTIRKKTGIGFIECIKYLKSTIEMQEATLINFDKIKNFMEKEKWKISVAEKKKKRDC